MRTAKSAFGAEARNRNLKSEIQPKNFGIFDKVAADLIAADLNPDLNLWNIFYSRPDAPNKIRFGTAFYRATNCAARSRNARENAREILPNLPPPRQADENIGGKQKKHKIRPALKLFLRNTPAESLRKARAFPIAASALQNQISRLRPARRTQKLRRKNRAKETAAKKRATPDFGRARYADKFRRDKAPSA